MATPRKDPKDRLPVGRPRKTEVDPAIAKAICDNLELAMPLDLAAEAEGVGRSTVRAACRRGRDGRFSPCVYRRGAHPPPTSIPVHHRVRDTRAGPHPT